MATKALFHHARIATGHGVKTEIFPAQRQLDVIAGLQTETVKVEVLKSYWLTVQIMMSSCEVYFDAGDDLIFRDGDFGFTYLANQFGPSYQAALNELHGY